MGIAVIVAATLSACGSMSATPVKRKIDPAADVSGLVQSYQRQIRERDKRIEDLEFQLKALKLIEQDFEKQRSPIRPPVTLTPIK
ncbi:MAG TPA: hypothetical protein VIR79_03885 [Nitrospira sp.]